jgi:hypothetical protein
MQSGFARKHKICGARPGGYAAEGQEGSSGIGRSSCFAQGERAFQYLKSYVCKAGNNADGNDSIPEAISSRPKQ